GLVRPGLVLNLLAGTVAGGGPDASPPSLVFGKSSSSQGFAGFLFGNAPEPDPFAPITPTQDSSINVPLEINDNRYYLTGYSNTIQTVQTETGKDVNLKLSFLDASQVAHVALHFVDKNNDAMSDTDPTITFDNGSVVKSDPDGILGDQISFTTSTDGIHHNFDFAFSFDQATNRNLMITAWDEKRNSANTNIYNAFEVTGQTIPDETSHLFLQDLGQFIITGDDTYHVGSQVTQQPEQFGFDYPDTIGRIERHDTALYDVISDEKTRAGQVMDEKFNLGTQTFVEKTVKPFDTKRASELSWSFVGHKLRDFTKTPEENNELIKGLAWQEHLRAQKVLDSLLVESKYRE
ncbi:MAG TPA: hypothetical protein VLD38_07135, partial [Nitrosopumilaceae archaeon]|nr:hypothetical protein [Nitrosopumilaceae archaeon]